MSSNENIVSDGDLAMLLIQAAHAAGRDQRLEALIEDHVDCLSPAQARYLASVLPPDAGVGFTLHSYADDAEPCPTGQGGSVADCKGKCLKGCPYHKAKGSK